jgi:hypothetical protein
MAGRCAKDRGGVQQKNKRCREEDGAESGLAQYLVEETVWGHLSAPAIQRVAALADADVTRALASRTPGFRYDSLQRLASLGSSGIYPNHMWAELETMLSPSKFLCRATIDMPMKVQGARAGFAHFKQSINDPHVMFADIYENYQEAAVEYVRFVHALECKVSCLVINVV